MSAFGEDDVDRRDGIGARQEIGVRASCFKAHAEDGNAETHETKRHHEGTFRTSCVKDSACHIAHQLETVRSFKNLPI